MIDILDSEFNVVMHLNKMQTFVFYSADGYTTIDELFVGYGGISEKDKELILGLAQELIHEFKFIDLWDIREELHYCIDLPKSKYIQEHLEEFNNEIYPETIKKLYPNWIIERFNMKFWKE